jgi:hypothetical protein
MMGIKEVDWKYTHYNLEACIKTHLHFMEPSMNSRVLLILIQWTFSETKEWKSAPKETLIHV